MTLNQSSFLPSSWLAKAVRSAGKGMTAVALLVGAAGLTAGCLDRPVTPATPQTTNVYISQIRQTGVDKIDLLFMIDNSISMSDKQAILAQAVPVLVQRLITPTCVDTNGAPVGSGAVADASGHCPTGQGVPEFNAIKDIHIGVISSSLGDHGSADVCSDAQNQANVGGGGVMSNYNDGAQLLPSVRPAGLYSWNNSGFLVWDPRDQTKVTDKHTPIGPGETMKDTFNTNFTAMVVAAGEHGCGYEAQLESWYRFLVDPEPVLNMGNNGATSVRPRGADKAVTVNNVVLQQRAAFLRPDSLLAVVMLTDENDCSINDEDNAQGWLVGFKGGVGQLSWHMPRARSVCATNPNDSNCAPCTAGDSDPACAAGTTLLLNEDSMNERCYNQVQRFGINLLYPPGRYVEGLSRKLITPHTDKGQVPNPVFAASGGLPSREPELVFLAGIVGVPWQDVSTEDSWNGRGLKYMTAQELVDNKRWDVILGDPYASPPILPSDPLMIESIDPRTTGAPHPLIANAAVVGPTGGGTNPINGHEQDVLPQRDDLQFACIFPLMPPKSAADCTANSDACDCNLDEFDKHSPLCSGTTAAADGQQVSAKGYPGVRELQVLQGLLNQSIVASICPKNITAQGMAGSDPDFGYNPAVAAIVDRLKEALTVKCLPRPLTPGTAENSAPEDVGKVPCAVVEVRPQQMGMCPACDPTLGRSDLVGERAKVVPAAREFLKNEGECDGAATPCSQECFCELTQFTGADLTACQTGTDSGVKYGYCYVDPEAETAVATSPGSDGGVSITPAEQSLIDGETSLVKDCSATQKRILRFIGEDVPAKDGVAFIACIGANSAK